MAKYKFSVAERYSIYTVFGARCYWCKKPLAFVDCELDHVIPESLITDQKQVDAIIELYKLPVDFTINSFNNWGLIHSSCNKKKAKKTFKLAPFIGEILHDINKQVPKIEKLNQKIQKEMSNPLLAALLENAISSQQISVQTIEKILDKNKKLQNLSASAIHNVFNCTSSTTTHKGKYGRKSPKQLYDISYDTFDTDFKPLLELNDLIRAKGVYELMGARKNYFNNLIGIGDDEWYSEIDSSHDFHMRFTMVNKGLISFTTSNYFFNTGAAHGQYTISGETYYLEPLRPFELRSIISDYRGFLEKIRPLVYDKMLKELKAREESFEIDEHDPIDKSALESLDAFDNYHFTETSLAFIFNPYEISAWSYGAHFPEFSFEELAKLFPDELGLINLMLSIKKSINTGSKKKK